MLSKRTIVNLLLVSVIAGLTLYIKKNPNENRFPKTIPLTTQTAEAIDTIVIQRQDKEEIVLEKDQSVWKMSYPKQVLANPQQVASILKFLDYKSRYQQNVTEKGLARYQLNNPLATLILNDQSYNFGSKNPFNEYRYVLVENTVHSIKDITYHQLMMGVDSFIKN